MEPTDIAFRERLLDVLGRTKLSRRGLSSALGRDPGYVAALLDPTRPSRTRPTPADLIRVSDATGIAFIELLELLWGIPRDRLVEELGPAAPAKKAMRGLTDDDLVLLAEFAAFLRSGRRRSRGRNPDADGDDITIARVAEDAPREDERVGGAPADGLETSPGRLEQEPRGAGRHV